MNIRRDCKIKKRTEGENKIGEQIHLNANTRTDRQTDKLTELTTGSSEFCQV